MGTPSDTTKCRPPSLTIFSLTYWCVALFIIYNYNSNLVWEEYSHRVALAEEEVIAMMAGLIGYDPEQAGGMFTFGGTGTTLYGINLGLEKALPDSMKHGIREDAVVFASDGSHYCRYNIAGWLGLGAKIIIVFGGFALSQAVRKNR